MIGDAVVKTSSSGTRLILITLRRATITVAWIGGEDTHAYFLSRRVSSAT